mmetsp:Transcript_11386/g.37424  ORF Transcript_11386/g.37424 Transcript_11386/m.37424 type:complete len:215 (-) Transcript_11386:165-809(-)
MDFDDAETMPFDVKEYRKVIKCVPGIESLYVMIRAMLERADIRRVLVVGCGGGLEVEALAGARFDVVGVDPSEEMLALVEGDVELIHGTIDDVPLGGRPFDAATSVLVMHFFQREEKGRYLSEIRARLRDGASFVLVDVCYFQDKGELDEQKPAFLKHAELLDLPPPDKAIRDIPTMPLLSDAETRALLRDHGFEVQFPFFRSLWYAGFLAKAV